MSDRAIPRTKIVATVGPASESPALLGRLIEAGVSVFRLNLSHGTLEAQEPRVRAIRQEAARLGAAVAILGDLPGPKIRVGQVAGAGIELSPGQDVVIDPRAGEARADKHGIVLGCTYTGIGADVLPGQKVLINDGAVRLLAVERVKGDDASVVRCRVVGGGLVSSGKGINLPQSDLRIPALTERDWRAVEWAVGLGLDFLAMSFVRSAAEVLQLKKHLAGVCAVSHDDHGESGGALIPVIAKMEKPQAVENMQEIIEAADAIMVARGDLGVEMDLSMVPVVQKRLIACAQEHGKTCIVATQMLETMIHNATPTRAEASDVANAVLDGADAVMLSGETAIGKHPGLVVETMRRIIEAAERTIPTWPAEPSPPGRVVETGFRTAALAHGAWHIARDIGAAAVACWSQRGGGAARQLSQMGFQVPIAAFSSAERETRRMALLRGVVPILAQPPADGRLATWATQASHAMLRCGLVNVGDGIVLMAGSPLGSPGASTLIMVHYVDAGDAASPG